MTFDPSKLICIGLRFFHQIWWPQGISKQIDLWLIPDDSRLIFEPNNAIHSTQGSSNQIW